MTRKREQKEKAMDELLINFDELPLEPEKPKTYFVKVIHPSLRRRNAPALSGKEVGLITDQGIYEIFDENNGWGKLENGDWIMLSYTKVVDKI
jgi:hypothetical protein